MSTIDSHEREVAHYLIGSTPGLFIDPLVASKEKNNGPDKRRTPIEVYNSDGSAK